MESKDSTAKVISIVALVVAVIGVSVGFAAFSNTLTISSTVTVSPDESNFDVNFSSSETAEVDGSVIPTKTPATATDDELSGTVATIDNTGAPTIKNLHADFTEPGQSVSYSFYSHNNGKLVAYLKAVSFANVDNNSNKKCTAKPGTTQALVDQACNGISISVKVGNNTFSGSDGNITDHSLAIDQYEPVVVTISYDSSAKVADGDFDVQFGDITLTYSSVD